jgi:hypothetical protein
MVGKLKALLMVAGSAVQKCKFRRTPTIIDGCFRYVN